MSGYYDRDKDGSDGLQAAQPTMQWPKPHFGSVPEYQVSGWPFVANVAGGVSEELVDFGYVTRWIVLSCAGADATVAFKSSGEEFSIPANSAVRLEVKCTKIYISTSTNAVSIIAGLTAVSDTEFPDISTRDGI